MAFGLATIGLALPLDRFGFLLLACNKSCTLALVCCYFLWCISNICFRVGNDGFGLYPSWDRKSRLFSNLHTYINNVTIVQFIIYYEEVSTDFYKPVLISTDLFIWCMMFECCHQYNWFETSLVLSRGGEFEL